MSLSSVCLHLPRSSQPVLLPRSAILAILSNLPPFSYTEAIDLVCGYKVNGRRRLADCLLVPHVRQLAIVHAQRFGGETDRWMESEAVTILFSCCTSIDEVLSLMNELNPLFCPDE